MFKRVILLIFLITLLAPAAVFAGRPAIGDVISRQIIEALPWDSSNVEVAEISIPGLESVGDYDDARALVAIGKAKIGKITFQVSFIKDGVEVKSLWASARIKVYRKAVVALKPLKANGRINAGDIRLTRVDVENTRDSFLSIDAVAGLLAKRPIRAGEVIKKSYVKPERLVKRGDRVVLSVQGTTIKIKSKGTAVEDGSLGRSIGVKTASGREISGRVVGPGEVVVEF